MSDQYILMPDHTTVKEDDVLRWAKNFEQQHKQVDRTDLGNGVIISTVFLGLDHRWGDGPPLLFETMAFIEDGGEDMDRYSTWDEAVTGHADFVKRWSGEAYVDYWQEKIEEAQQKIEHWTEKKQKAEAAMVEEPSNENKNI